MNEAKLTIQSLISHHNKVIGYEVRNNQLIATLKSGCNLWVKI